MQCCGENAMPAKCSQVDVGFSFIAFTMIAQASRPGRRYRRLSTAPCRIPAAPSSPAPRCASPIRDTKLMERNVQKPDLTASFTAPLLPGRNLFTVPAFRAEALPKRDFRGIVVRVTETTRMIAKLTPRACSSTSKFRPRYSSRRHHRRHLPARQMTANCARPVCSLHKIFSRRCSRCRAARKANSTPPLNLDAVTCASK